MPALKGTSNMNNIPGVWAINTVTGVQEMPDRLKNAGVRGESSEGVAIAGDIGIE